MPAWIEHARTHERISRHRLDSAPEERRMYSDRRRLVVEYPSTTERNCLSKKRVLKSHNLVETKFALGLPMCLGQVGVFSVRLGALPGETGEELALVVRNRLHCPTGIRAHPVHCLKTGSASDMLQVQMNIGFKWDDPGICNSAATPVEQKRFRRTAERSDRSLNGM